MKLIWITGAGHRRWRGTLASIPNPRVKTKTALVDRFMFLVPRAGFGPTTSGSGDQRSIQLSYRGKRLVATAVGASLFPICFLGQDEADVPFKGTGQFKPFQVREMHDGVDLFPADQKIGFQLSPDPLIFGQRFALLVNGFDNHVIGMSGPQSHVIGPQDLHHQWIFAEPQLFQSIKLIRKNVDDVADNLRGGHNIHILALYAAQFTSIRA